VSESGSPCVVSAAQRRLDTDHLQRSVYEWSQARDRNPEVETKVKVEVVNLQEDGFHIPDSKDADVIVYDCPGWSDESTLLAAQQADLIVLPTGPTVKDMKPLLRLLYELLAEGVKPDRIAVVLFRVHSKKEEQDARDYMTTDHSEIVPVPGYIADSSAISRADSVGASVLEFGTDIQCEAAANAIEELIDRIGRFDERSGEVDWKSFDWERAAS